MENNDVSIATLNWPYRRFDALVSKKCKDDILIWLIIKLGIAMNKQFNRAENAWDDNNAEYARSFIAKSFKSRISDEMVDKALDYIEHKYMTVERDDLNSDRRELLSDDAVAMSKNMQSVYSSDLGSLYIYQDLICETVLPYTKDIKHFGTKAKDSHDLLAEDLNGPYPKDISIANAIEIADAIAKTADASELDFDEDDVAFDDSVEVSPSFKANLVTEDRPVIGYLYIKLLISEGRIVATSPVLGERYNEWLTTRLREGRNINKELDEILLELEKKYELGKKIEIEEQTFTGRRSKKRELVYFSETYKVISEKLEHVSDVAKYLELVVRMDGEAAAHNQNAYTDAGHLMTSFVEPFFEAASGRPDKECYRFADFCKEIDTYFGLIGQSEIGCSKYKNKDIYIMYVKDGNAARKPDKTVHSSSSKSDFVDGILLNIDEWKKCESMYQDFAYEFFSILGLRNKQGAHNLKLRTCISKEDIDMINRVVNVFCDFYKQSIITKN